MRTPVGVAMAALVALAAAQAFAPRETPPLAATELRVERLHLNTLAQSKAGLISAGELGVILISTDRGKTWQRASLNRDRQALINQISFGPDGMSGMAVGHEGWILRSDDGGWSWKEIAFTEKHGDPLMSVARLPSGEWLAVGAFGRALRSDAKGEHWQPLALPADGVEDKHLNRIAGSADGRQWLIVGERGMVLNSTDAGSSWQPVDPFYKGSFYNAAALPDGGWLVYGMRGNAFRSPTGNKGQAPWTPSALPAPVSFFGHALMADGRLLLVGQGGLIATSSDGGGSFSIARAQGRATLTDLLVNPDGHGWITSDAGMQPFPPPTPPAAPAAATSGAPR